MLNKKIFIMLITFTISILIVSKEICNAWEHETCDVIKTKFGNVRVIRSIPELPANIVTVNGKEVFQSGGDYAFLYKSFRTSNYIAVLFGENAGGSATPVDTLYFLLLRPNKKPIVIRNKDFYSADGTMIIKQKNNDVLFDLGFEEKKKKTAILTSGKIVVRYDMVGVLPMELEDCNWLYENSMNECIKLRSDCEQARDYSGDCVATMTGITVLSNHPGFASSALDDICVTACKTGTAITFEQFKKRVCSFPKN
ncbi:MAG: hypothetical protein CVU55_13960 [Deltaproteobacteria bacterium HGW-Deltaproteobacteria-13]|jgi:hypothetical protein|nr:MAG: hypothetical protein CVU55_13960 [Deltaproteobacteria bacterium HGW-Deltaproteobacteria-13]